MIALRVLANGHIVRESVFKETPIVIGRGPESDFALVDSSVSRRHASVVTDDEGATWIENAGARNGVWIGARNVERAPVPAGGLRCRLGAVDVEVVVASADETLTLQALPATPRGPVGASGALAFWAAGVAAVAALLLIEPGFWSPWQEEQLSRLSWATLLAAVGLPMVSFVLIGLLRIVGRRVAVTEMLRALAAVGWGWVLLWAFQYATWYGLSVAAHGVASALLWSGGLMVSVAFLASVARAGPRRRFFVAWLAATGLLVMAVWAAASLTARQAGTPKVEFDVVMPIGTWTGPASSLDGYLGAVRADFARAQGHAAQERGRLSPP